MSVVADGAWASRGHRARLLWSRRAAVEAKRAAAEVQRDESRIDELIARGAEVAAGLLRRQEENHVGEALTALFAGPRGRE